MWWRNYSQTFFLKIEIEHFYAKYYMPSWKLSTYFKTKLQITCFYLKDFFFKKKKKSEISLPASFSAWFLKKNISVIFYCLTKFQCMVIFTLWDIRQYVYCSCLLTRMWCHEYLNYDYLSNKTAFAAWSKSQDKKLNILKTKSVFNEMKSVFHF